MEVFYLEKAHGQRSQIDEFLLSFLIPMLETLLKSSVPLVRSQVAKIFIFAHSLLNSENFEIQNSHFLEKCIEILTDSDLTVRMELLESPYVTWKILLNSHIICERLQFLLNDPTCESLLKCAILRNVGIYVINEEWFQNALYILKDSTKNSIVKHEIRRLLSCSPHEELIMDLEESLDEVLPVDPEAAHGQVISLSRDLGLSPQELPRKFKRGFVTKTKGNDGQGLDIPWIPSQLTCRISTNASTVAYCSETLFTGHYDGSLQEWKTFTLAEKGSQAEHVELINLNECIRKIFPLTVSELVVGTDSTIRRITFSRNGMRTHIQTFDSVNMTTRLVWLNCFEETVFAAWEDQIIAYSHDGKTKWRLDVSLADGLIVSCDLAKSYHYESSSRPLWMMFGTTRGILSLVDLRIGILVNRWKVSFESENHLNAINCLHIFESEAEDTEIDLSIKEGNEKIDRITVAIALENFAAIYTLYVHSSPSNWKCTCKGFYIKVSSDHSKFEPPFLNILEDHSDKLHEDISTVAIDTKAVNMLHNSNEQTAFISSICSGNLGLLRPISFYLGDTAGWLTYWVGFDDLIVPTYPSQVIGNGLEETSRNHIQMTTLDIFSDLQTMSIPCSIEYKQDQNFDIKSNHSNVVDQILIIPTPSHLQLTALACTLCSDGSLSIYI